MDSAIAGLIGVGVGAGLTLLNEKLKWNRQREADDLKWQRESAVRYNADRVEAYAALLRLGKAVIDADWGTPEPPDTTELSVAYYRAELIASAPVRQAAADYHGAVLLPVLVKRLNIHPLTRSPQGREIVDALQQPSDPEWLAQVNADDPATQQWVADARRSAVREPSIVNGAPSLSAIVSVKAAEQTLMDAIREELGVAPPTQHVPEDARRRIPLWRATRRRTHNAATKERAE